MAYYRGKYNIADLPIVSGILRQDKSLANMSWFNTGGSADFFFSPKTPDDLVYFLQNKPNDLPITVIGAGSNLLVRDGGVDGVVIRLGQAFNSVRILPENCIEVGASTLDLNIALAALESGIEGMEFLSGIPGTIGGGIAMNAGAYGLEIKDILIHAHGVDIKTGKVRQIKNNEFDFKYRSNGIEDMIFITALLKGKPGRYQEIKAKIDDIALKRSTTQPIKSRTCGSTFANPSRKKAWQLIEQAGCKELKIGGAHVSSMHSNFIINDGTATASDIEKLIKEIQQRVLDSTGVLLVPEVKVIGLATKKYQQS